jgi:hypothetical protein
VFSAEQLKATFTPDGGHNLDALTAGDLTVTVWFTVPSTLTALSKQVTHSDLTASAGSESIDFDSALPANAIILASEIKVDTLFDDGAAAVSDVDLGISGGDTDRIEDGLNTTLATGATGRQSGTAGIQPQGFYGGETLAVTVNAGVDVDTLSQGDVTATVWYINL